MFFEQNNINIIKFVELLSCIQTTFFLSLFSVFYSLSRIAECCARLFEVKIQPYGEVYFTDYYVKCIRCSNWWRLKFYAKHIHDVFVELFSVTKARWVRFFTNNRSFVQQIYFLYFRLCDIFLALLKVWVRQAQILK